MCMHTGWYWFAGWYDFGFFLAFSVSFWGRRPGIPSRNMGTDPGLGRPAGVTPNDGKKPQKYETKQTQHDDSVWTKGMPYAKWVGKNSY